MPLCPICGESLLISVETHERQKHPEYFKEVRKWQLAYGLSTISVFTFIVLNFLNNILSSNIFLLALFSIGGLVAVLFLFFTLLKLRGVAKKYGTSWRKTLQLLPSQPSYYQKQIIRAIAKATGRSEKEIEAKMKKHTAQD